MLNYFLNLRVTPVIHKIHDQKHYIRSLLVLITKSFQRRNLIVSKIGRFLKHMYLVIKFSFWFLKHMSLLPKHLNMSLY